MALTASPELYRRYLRLLGVDPGPPSLGLLREIVHNHLERIPFENISKLYYLKRFGLQGVPDFELYLDGIERYNFGGTCYSNNVHLNALLRFVGFDVDLCGADMSEPDVHIVNLVRVEDREYLVDVGYGAPFFEPIPRDLDTDRVVSLGNERWVVKPPDTRGRTVVEHHRQGEYIHGYVARATPRDPLHFSQVILDSFREDATFMNSIRLIRFTGGRGVAIADEVFYRATELKWNIQKLADRSDLSVTIEKYFGISAAIGHEAVADIGNLQPGRPVSVFDRTRSEQQRSDPQKRSIE